MIRTISSTIRYAVEKHGKQAYGDLPFSVHLALVARHFTDYRLMTIAYLHDILEDTDVTYQQLLDWYDAEIADAVNALTRRDDEDYLKEYIPRVAKNKLATRVKMADLEENLHSATHWYNDKYQSLIGRYSKALAYLYDTRDA